ncbi:hypothetical protein, partial [Escherichia coli]|uniref:hypothetical protein n=1 Tax=Escherichia coli TaxID=562 RepID=UPI00075166E0
PTFGNGCRPDKATASHQALIAGCGVNALSGLHSARVTQALTFSHKGAGIKTIPTLPLENL